MIVFVIYLATLYFVGQFLNITFQIEIELFDVSSIFTRHPPPVEKCCRAQTASLSTNSRSALAKSLTSASIRWTIAGTLSKVSVRLLN